MPGPEDDCPVCYEGLHGTEEAKLAFCAQCGNGLHKECFDQCKELYTVVCSGLTRPTRGAHGAATDVCILSCGMGDGPGPSVGRVSGGDVAYRAIFESGGGGGSESRARYEQL